MNKLLLYQTAHMDYPYTLPPLDYAYDALEPHIDEQTMHLHHDRLSGLHRSRQRSGRKIS